MHMVVTAFVAPSRIHNAVLMSIKPSEFFKNSEGCS